MQKQRNWFLVPLVIFTCCYFAVGYYNRFASDDFEFLNKLREYGYFGSVQWFHSHWNTRWSAIGLLNGVLLFTLNAGTLFYYHLVSIVLLWYAFYRIIQSVLAQDKLTGGIMAGYATTAFFYSCFSINDVFFWINTSTMYLYGCIALLFAIAELTTRKHTFFSYVRLSLFGLFIAGAYEPLVITAGVTCIFLLAIPLYRKSFMSLQMAINKKLIILLVALAAGFLISFSGEGHVIRSEYLPQTGFIFKIWVWIKAVIKMFGMYMPGKILPVMLFSLPWFVYGANTGFSWLTPRVLKIISLGFVFLVILSLAPAAFIMSEMGPERAWTQIVVYMVIFAAVLACYAGTALKRKYDMNNVTKLYAVIAMMYILATGIPVVLVTRNYSGSYDERIKYMLDENDKERKQVLLLNPLPASGWLHTAEISADTTNFNNVFIKNFLKLSFTPALR